MSDVENDLRGRVDAFVGELHALIRRQALLAVEEVLRAAGGGRVGRSTSVGRVTRVNGARHSAAPARSANASYAKARYAKAGSAQARYAQAPPAKRKAGEKRTQEELQQVCDRVQSYIRSNAGQGVERIAKALATPTKELTLPIRKLLDDKKIGSKGQKRATRYYPR